MKVFYFSFSVSYAFKKKKGLYLDTLIIGKNDAVCEV